MLDKNTTINLFSIRTLRLWAAIVSMGLFFGCSAEVNGPDVTFPGNGFGNFNWNFTESKTFADEYPAQSYTRIDVDAINGQVLITGQADINSVSVAADLFASADELADAKADLADLEIQVTGHGDELLIRTVHPERSYRRMYRVEYHIIVPEEFEVLVTQANGRIEISDVQNSVEVSNANGDVQLNDIYGGVKADVDNGTIEGVVILPLDQAIDWSIQNGSLDLRIPASTSAELSAFIGGNGDIRISNLDVGDAVKTPKTLSGSLGAGEGSITLSTINGKIDIIGFN